MITDNQINALQYVKNTNGGATKENFFDDHDPIGKMLWKDISGMVMEDENGKIWLTKFGQEVLSAQEKKK